MHTHTHMHNAYKRVHNAYTHAHSSYICVKYWCPDHTVPDTPYCNQIGPRESTHTHATMNLEKLVSLSTTKLQFWRNNLSQTALKNMPDSTSSTDSKLHTSVSARVCTELDWGQFQAFSFSQIRASNFTVSAAKRRIPSESFSIAIWSSLRSLQNDFSFRETFSMYRRWAVGGRKLLHEEIDTWLEQGGGGHITLWSPHTSIHWQFLWDLLIWVLELLQK